MKRSKKNDIFWHWGKLMYRYRWAVLSAWLLVFALSAPLALKTPGMLKDNGFTPQGSEADRGFTYMQEELGYPPVSLTLVYSEEDRQAEAARGAQRNDEQRKKIIIDSLADLRDQPYVESITFLDAELLPGEHTVDVVNVALNLNENEALERFAQIKQQVRAPAGFTVQVTGGTAVVHDMAVASKNDIVKAELIGLPIALIVLLIIFGTLFAAVLPMIVGLTSVTVTLGVTYFIATQLSLSNFLPNIVTMLGLAVGIDYALFMVSRFREELKVQSNVADAVAVTCQTAGRSIFFSGIAVLIGLFGMLFIPLNIFLSLSLGGVLVVSMSVLVGNTLLIALLGMIGHKINSLPVTPRSWRMRGQSAFWSRVAYTVMKRPVVLVLAACILLITFMVPLFKIKMGMPNAEVLPPTYESRSGSDLLKQTYDPREMSPVQIVVQSDRAMWELTSIENMQRLSALISELPGVKEVRSYVNVLPVDDPVQLAAMFTQQEVREQMEQAKLAKNSNSIIFVVPETDPSDRKTEQLVKQLRTIEVNGLNTFVTGETAARVDILERINSRLPTVLGFVMGITYLILMFAFRSIILPLKAVLMNVLSLGASLGIVVSVFQNGVMADLFQITSIGYVVAVIPVIIFCVVFGISMDYEVFLISRIMEEYAESGNNGESTAQGLAKTGSLITSAALILIVVVGTFIFTDIEIMKALGLGLSTAILIDATLIRIVVVPALMKLMGHWNWRAPHWLRPIRHSGASS